MLKGLFIILLFQLIGDIIQKVFLLYFPGPVIGMILLLFFLLLSRNNNLFKNKVKPSLMVVSETLTHYLPLLFVPVGVGVVMHLSYLKNNHFIILIIIFLSTLLTIGITALLMSKLSKKND